MAGVLWVVVLTGFGAGFHLGGLAIVWFAVGLAVAILIPAVRHSRSAAVGLAALLCVACVLLATLLGLYFLPSALLLLVAATTLPRRARLTPTTG